MAESREPLLPDGLSDLGDRIRIEEEFERLSRAAWMKEHREFREFLRSKNTKTSPELFEILLKNLGPERVYEEDLEYLRPHIERLIEKENPELFGSESLDRKFKTKFVSVCTNGIWTETCRRRPRYPGDKRALPKSADPPPA